MNFHYLRHKVEPKEHGKEYLRLLPKLLNKAIPKAPPGAGKNIASIHCDYRNDIDIKELRDRITPIFTKKKYVILEEPLMTSSNFNTVGILYADIIGYLAARIDTISTDSELFEGITPEQFETNGKIKKLRSSVSLISKIKNIGNYETKIK